jgi:hypothetical protein
MNWRTTLAEFSKVDSYFITTQQTIYGIVEAPRHHDSLLLLDRPQTWFRVFGHAATYIGSFCVFGPVLSSPAHAAASLAMPPI